MLTFGKSVLLVGAFEGKLHALKNAVDSTGIDLQHAADLSSAVERQRAAPASVVVCDLGTLSECRQALRVLREAQPGASVILLAPPSGWRWIDMLENGAFDILSSQYRTDDLLWVVRNALGAPSARFAATGSM